MASGAAEASTPGPAAGPVLLAYDGCDLAKLAIEEAGRQFAPAREALVVCVWQPVDVGFVLPSGRQINTSEATEVKEAAMETAAHGALLAQKAGFRAQSIAVEAAPTWKGIVELAEQRHAGVIVLGAHRRRGLTGHLLGSVTAAVIKHSTFTVLVVQGQS